MGKYIRVRTKDGLSVHVGKLVLSKKDKELLHLYSLDGEGIGYVDLGISMFKFEDSTDFSKGYILVKKNG